MANARAHWLCPAGPYSEHIVAQERLDPILRLPDDTNAECPLWSRKASVTLLSVYPRQSGKQEISRADFDTASDLEAYLDGGKSGTAPREPCGRIFIMENLSHAFIGYLGHLLRIPPRFFVEHERNRLASHDHDTPQVTPHLRSTLERSRSHILRYYELLEFGLMPTAFYLRCAETGRHVAAQIVGGKLEQVGLLKRCCSYWTNDTGTSKCWDILILSDPPLTQLRQGAYPRDRVIDIRPEPLQGGYVDFLDANAAELGSSPPGPGRNSLREDFCYYLTRLAAGDRVSGCRPVDARNILHKIIASHYVRFVEYERSIVGKHEWYMSGLQDLDIFRQREVEQQWGYLQLVNRRLIAYNEDISDIMQVCARLRKETSSGSNSSSEEDSTQDFEAVAESLSRIKLRVEQLINSMTGLASIVGNKQAVRESQRSLREAKTVKTLTTLGMIFAPLALVCGLLSMHSLYLPGSGRFWLYFAIGIPLVLVVFVVFYVIDLGYGEDGDWSFFRLITNIRKLKPMPLLGTKYR